MNGFDAIQNIQQLIMYNNNFKQPYICLATSATIDDKIREKVNQIGIDQVKQKPLFKAAAIQLLIDSEIIDM